MKIANFFLILHFVFFFNSAFSQRGKNGAMVVSSYITPNAYTVTTSDLSPGATTINVVNSTLTNSILTAPLTAGDLIMIIQIEGATITGGAANDYTWGVVTNYNNCGNYEFVQVASRPNNTSIVIDCGLKKAYTASGGTVIVRVPRFTSLTVNSGGLTAQPYFKNNGGGVLAVEVLGNTVLNSVGALNATGCGFQSGKSYVTQGVPTYGITNIASTNINNGGEKGGGIAGQLTDLNVFGGGYCRGQPANGGGGGNSFNAGGGGGANAGSLTGFDGQGIPNTLGNFPNYIAAWNLEGPNFANHNSPGGGRGGYSWADSSLVDIDAIIHGPGDPIWKGDGRRNVGGLGGQNLDYSTGRIFLGGGGGAGACSNIATSPQAGGTGGGIIYLMSYGNVSGSASGFVTSIGSTPGLSGSPNNQNPGGAGGGGAGGTILINSVGPISGFTIAANGAYGGQVSHYAPVPINAYFERASGGGGGGGGGYIATSNGSVIQNVNGGTGSGLVTSNLISEFSFNGATDGGSGLSNQLITWDTIKSQNYTICAGNSATLSAAMYGTVPPGTSIVWYSAIAGGTVLGTGPTFTTPILNSDTTFYVGFCPGTYRIPVVVTVISGANTVITQQNSLCATAPPVTLSVSGSGGTWSGTGITNGTTGVFNPSVAGVGSHVITYTITTPCIATDTMTIVVTAPPNATITQVGPFCVNDTAVITLNAATSGGTFTGLGILNGVTGTFRPSTAGAGTHVITYSITNPCPSTDTMSIVVTPIPNATITQAGPFCVGGSTVNLSAGSAGGTWSGTGITNGATGTFDPATAGLGSHLITYTISGACPGVDTMTISVIQSPAITITQSGPFCITNAATNLTATLPGGTWTGSGITNGTSGTFNPTVAGVGSHIITYTITNPCIASDTMTIVVASAPNATITQAGPLCILASSVTLSAATGGGTWTGTGITNGAAGVFDPAIAGNGSHIITYTIGGTCPGIDTVTIVVYSSINATITQAGPYCVSNPQITLSAATGGGTWSGTGITNGATGVFDPAIAGVGSHVITYTIGGPCPGTDTMSIVITLNADATITQAGPFCVSSSSVTLNAQTAGGTWTGTGITNATTGVFNPAIAGIGSHVITYTISGSCADVDTMTIVINPAANATITQAGPFCVLNSSVTLNAATGGGTWSGTGITNASTGTFDPAVAGIGSHVITYTIGGACPGVDNMTIIVNSTSDATITQAGPYCVSNGVVTLSAATGGGTWSGTGITNAATGAFDPSIAGIGSHVITYSIGGACPGSDVMTVVITLNADATITQAGPFCVSASSVILNAQTAGGTWTGTGITNGATGVFNPTIAGVGSHLITYTITGGCSGTDTMVVVVNNSADATITQAGPYCVLNSSVALNAATGGGIWSGIGITNASTGTFDPVTAGVGSHVITYTIAGVCPGIDTMTIVVNTTSNATITQAGPYCVSNGQVTLAAATGGGTWSGTGITNGATGDFDPAVAGVGSHVITYAIGGACPATDTMTVVINLNTNATITQAGPFCVSNGSVLLSAATAGGTWTGTGIVNGSTGMFAPSTAGVGSHIITYTISGGCAGTDTMTIVVNNSADATITQAGPYCVSASSVNLSAITTGGTWTGTGITNATTGVFDPAVAGVGSHIITYTIGGACPAIDTMTVVVVLIANATINPVNAVCANSAAFNMTSATPGGTWSGTGITNAATGTFDPAVSGVGTFTITYVISGPCGDTATQTVRVNPLPTPNVTSSAVQGCEPLCTQFNESTGANCASVIYNFGDGNTSTNSTPTHCYTQSGTFTVSITCTDINNCSATTTVNNMILVYSNPIANASVDDNSIYQGSSATLTATGGATYNWFPASDLSCTNCASPIASPSQTITYCVEVSTNGCVDTACVKITVEDIPCAGNNNLAVPNAFSPNADGVNDMFCLEGWDECVEEFYITIYDRWGEKVYYSKNKNFCWDGENRGKVMDAQVLVYYIKATSKNNVVIKKRGNISLIR